MNMQVQITNSTSPALRQPFVLSGDDLDRVLKGTEEDDGLVRRDFGFKIETTSIDLENRTCDFIFSTASLDSYDEIVVQDWEARLYRFRSNPVILYGHNRAAFFDKIEDTLPVGHCIEIGVVNGALRGRVKFVTAEANPFAELVWQSVIQGSLRATSVGFRPHTIKYETINDVERLVLSDNELYEVSICPMGANADAVRLSTGQHNQRQRLLDLASKQGTDMDPKEIQKLKDDAAAANARAAELEIANKNAEELRAKAEEDAKEARELATKAETEKSALRAKEIANKAHALVGKKIVKAQVADAITLMCSPQADVFEAFMKNQPELGLTEQKTQTNVLSETAIGGALAKSAMAEYEKALAENA